MARHACDDTEEMLWCWHSLIQGSAAQGCREGRLHSRHPGTPTQQLDRLDVHPRSTLKAVALQDGAQWPGC